MLLVLPVALYAHEPVSTKITWTREISRIVFHRCVACHRDRGPAPMALLAYQEVRPWAKAIKEEVLARRMPPWGAMKGFGDFRDDGGLTQDEIGTIAQWVEGGAPEGDPKYLPPAPRREEPAGVPGTGGLTASDGTVLKRRLPLRAIRPLADCSEARAIARLPDGSVEPLIWLHGYSAKWRRTFVLREPLVLPAGTRIETGGAKLALE